MKNHFYAYVKSHSLVNRIYDMLDYFGVFKDTKNKVAIKRFFSMRLEDIEYVESLAKYFEEQMKKNKKNIEVRCNLRDLIYDLDYLKQYLM